MKAVLSGILILLALAPMASSVLAGDAAAFEPAKTKVLVLPVLERSGREGKEREEFIQLGTATLRADFSKAGFSIVDGDCEAAARELKIDLKDDEQRTRANYAQLARKFNARLVAASAIRGVASGVRGGVFGARKAGRASVELDVYDITADSYVVKAAFTGGKDGSVFLPGLDSSKDKRMGAISAAFHKGFQEFLKGAGSYG